MLVNTSNYAAAPVGAALPDVRSPWTSLSFAVANHVRPQLHAAVVLPEARLGALPPAMAAAQTHQLAVVAAGLMMTDDVQKQQKQNNDKTRIGAGGYGAMGPHPEREPA